MLYMCCMHVSVRVSVKVKCGCQYACECVYKILVCVLVCILLFYFFKYGCLYVHEVCFEFLFHWDVLIDHLKGQSDLACLSFENYTTIVWNSAGTTRKKCSHN